MTDSVKITTSNSHFNMDSGDLLLASNNNLKLIRENNQCDSNMNMSNSVENTQTNTNIRKTKGSYDIIKIAPLFNIVPEIKPSPPEYKLMYRCKDNKRRWRTVNMGNNTFDECLDEYKDEARLLDFWGFDVDKWTFFKVVYSYCGCNVIIVRGKLKLYYDDDGKIQVEYLTTPYNPNRTIYE